MRPEDGREAFRSRPGLAALLPAVGLAALVASPLAGAPQGAFSVRADSVATDLTAQHVEASGNAVLSYDGIELHADHIRADRASGQVEASGHITLTQEGLTVTGRALEYNTYAQEGSLTEARAQQEGVIIGGERLEFSPREVVAYQAYLTTCDRPRPDYEFRASRISLTAPEPVARGRRQTARLSLEHASFYFYGRRLFTVPRYSTTVGEISKPGGAPLPVSGFSRDDGPYASLTHNYSSPGRPFSADLLYRYTTYRGIRGHALLVDRAGPAELMYGYVRREDPTDQELRPDAFDSSVADVLVDRAPEYGVRLPAHAIGPSLSIGADVLWGDYSERVPHDPIARARADRTLVSVTADVAAYPVSPSLSISHAVGWRHTSYSTGSDLSILLVRHTVDFHPRPEARLALSYITRDGSGQTPFLFDGVAAGEELLSEVDWRLTRRWRVRLVDFYDLQNRETRDMVVSATRTVHCLDYTLGWRKARGAFFVAVGLAPAGSAEAAQGLAARR